MRNITDIATAEVLDTLTAHHPDWMIEMADNRQLQKCLGMDEQAARDWLVDAHTHIIARIHSAVYRTMMHTPE